MKKTVRKIAAALIVLATLVLSFVSCSKDSFDYEKAKLSKYISISADDYKNIELELKKYDEVTEKSITEYIDSLRQNNLTYKKAEGNDKALSDRDMVSLFFRAVVDGKDYYGDLDGISGYSQGSNSYIPVYAKGYNMANKSGYQLTIGSGGLCKPLEDYIIEHNLNLKDTKREVKDSGTVEMGDVLYYTYTAKYYTLAGFPNVYESYTARRIDLGNADDAAEFGFLIGKKIGENFEYKREMEIEGKDGKTTVTYTGVVNCVNVENALEVKVTFPEDYGKNDKKNHDITGLAGKEVTFYLIADEIYDQTRSADYKIKKGDTANIFYRGVITKVAADKYSDYVGQTTSGMMNYSSYLYSLAIGSGSFIDGFEDSLIGKGPVGKLQNVKTDGKITDFSAENDYYVFVDYRSTYGYGDSVKEYESGSYFVKLSEINEKIKTAGDVDFATLITNGAGEIGKAITKTVKGINVSTSDKADIQDLTYTVTVNLAVSTRDIDESLHFTVTFPTDYVTSSTGDTFMNGATVEFYVVIENVLPCVLPEVDDDFIKNTVKYESDKTGEELITDFKAYVRDYLEKTNRNNSITEASDVIWQALLDKAEVKKYPKSAVKEERDYVYDQLYMEFYYNKSMYGTSFLNVYPTVDDYIVGKGGLEDKSEIDDYLNEQGRARVKEKLLLFYICEAEKIEISDEEFETSKKQIISYYASYYGITEEQVAENYSDSDIRMQILSNLLIEKIYDLNYDHISWKD